MVSTACALRAARVRVDKYDAEGEAADEDEEDAEADEEEEEGEDADDVSTERDRETDDRAEKDKGSKRAKLTGGVASTSPQAARAPSFVQLAGCMGVRTTLTPSEPITNC